MTEQQLADSAAAGSAALAGWTWIAQVNDVLQLVATGVAIVAGIYAIRWHKVRIDEVERKRSKKDGKSD